MLARLVVVGPTQKSHPLTSGPSSQDLTLALPASQSIAHSPPQALGLLPPLQILACIWGLTLWPGLGEGEWASHTARL